MTTVSSIESSILEALQSTYTTSTTTNEDSDSLLMDDFLTIFLAQLQYQDPLDPMESSDMTAQLAQISMVEQQVDTNEILETISGLLAEQQTGNLLGYIGKEITIEGNVMTLQEGEILGGTYYLEEASDVEIVIYDSSGNEVSRLYPGELDEGEHEVEWDGRDSHGNAVEDGAYVYEVLATNSAGEDTAVQTTYTGIVTGVSYANDKRYLMVGDGLIDPDTVLMVGDATTVQASDGDESGADETTETT
ncbi:MAG: flagellar hook assembly protein FlgD [Deltaproteobacteria bacterium]|nr:flagellar hook assembly protein FlgD [Deltaproteobacteria bacterium]